MLKKFDFYDTKQTKIGFSFSQKCLKKKSLILFNKSLFF